MFKKTRLNPGDDDLFYHAFPENIQNGDIEIWIKIKHDNEDLEVNVDDKMEKDGSRESESCDTPVVTKVHEITVVG